MNENDIVTKVLDHAFEIHKAIGPGLLESVYVKCLKYRLDKSGLFVQHEFPIPVIFEEIRMECGYRADLIINKKVVIEVKAVDAFADLHTAQLLTHLRFSGCKLGLLLNFNTHQLKKGIKRVALNL